MRTLHIMLMICLLTCMIPGAEGAGHLHSVHHIFSGYAAVPALTATDDPFGVLPMLGVSYELVLDNRVGAGISLEHNRWQDYLGMYCGSNYFRAWTPMISLSWHFTGFARVMADPFAGISAGYCFMSQSNQLGNPCVDKVKNSVLIRPFAGLHWYPFYASAGSASNLGFLLQVNWNFNRDFSRINLIFGVSYRY